jgi:hypothetical protein
MEGLAVEGAGAVGGGGRLGLAALAFLFGLELAADAAADRRRVGGLLVYWRCPGGVLGAQGGALLAEVLDDAGGLVAAAGRCGGLEAAPGALEAGLEGRRGGDAERGGLA